MKYEIYTTEDFDAWLNGLKDPQARLRILARIATAESGHFGNATMLKGQDGLSEMRLDFGPGYRLYYGRFGRTVFYVLAGGVKKTQTGDIACALALWRKIKEGRNG